MNPYHNPLMSVLPSLYESGHFTLRDGVHIAEVVCQSVCSVTEMLWRVQGTSGLLYGGQDCDRSRDCLQCMCCQMDEDAF